MLSCKPSHSLWQHCSCVSGGTNQQPAISIGGSTEFQVFKSNWPSANSSPAGKGIVTSLIKITFPFQAPSQRQIHTNKPPVNRIWTCIELPSIMAGCKSYNTDLHQPTAAGKGLVVAFGLFQLVGGRPSAIHDELELVPGGLNSWHGRSMA